MNDDYEVIKQIGRGSFSNVYLCKQEIPLFIGESDHHDELFIIKEININKLVQSYILKNGGSNIKRVGRVKGVDNDNIGVNITPYETDDVLDNAEQDYYYKRLQELIESEIEILSNLDHPNVIKFYGYTKKHGIYYLRMEYCNGGDVYEFLKGNESEFLKGYNRNNLGGFTNTFLYNFCCQIVNGLDYIHNKNIIHRDIKLHNVLIKNVNNKIEFKISDFGFACYDLSDLLCKSVISESMCKKYYKLCGTPYYMAPEIILNMNNMENITSYKNGNYSDSKIYDKRIDIWSLGICIYELMFNILPFSNIKNINDLERFYSLEMIQEIMDKKINRRSCLKTEFKNVLLSMLKINKQERCSILNIDFFLKNCNGIGCLINDKNDFIQDMVNCRENVFIKNEDMKQHIIKNPVVKDRIPIVKDHIPVVKDHNPVVKDIDELNLSWEKINKSSSLIMKMSVQRGFLNWLFNKK
jgi:serine/threonine protein kinase